MTNNKKIAVLFILIVTACLLVSCVSVGDLHDYAGFNSSSKKALKQGILEIDFLRDSNLEETITDICESGNFSVAYSDRQRMIRFVSTDCPIKILVYNDHIDLLFEVIGLTTNGILTFECYGNSYSEKIITSSSHSSVSQILSKNAANFIYSNWNNNDLYLTFNGTTVRITNNDFVNLYRVLYGLLYPYEHLETDSIVAVTDFINAITTVTEDEYSSIIHFLGLNKNIPRKDFSELKNLLSDKIR